MTRLALSISNVEIFADIVAAVLRGSRVRYLNPETGTIVEGTLRGFTPAKDTSAHLPRNADLSHSWIRITTKGGFEIWVETRLLAGVKLGGGVEWSW